MSDTMRDAFESWMNKIKPDMQLTRHPDDSNRYECLYPDWTWTAWQAAQSQPSEQWTQAELKDLAERGLQAYECKICGCSAGAKAAPPGWKETAYGWAQSGESLLAEEQAKGAPVPDTVAEIVQLMMPYVAACVRFNSTPMAGIEYAEDAVKAAFKPLESALIALVEKTHELQFALDGVNAMREVAEHQAVPAIPEGMVSIEPIAEIYTEGNHTHLVQWKDGVRDLPDGPHLLFLSQPPAGQQDRGEAAIGYLPAYELGRLHSGHDAHLRSAKFGPSLLDSDVPVYLQPHVDYSLQAAAKRVFEVMGHDHQTEWDDCTSAQKEFYVCVAKAAIGVSHD